MAERNDLVESKGNKLTLVGDVVNVGDTAPDFEILDTDMKSVKLSDYKGKIVVLSSVPSLDTQVCDIETKTFNDQAKKLGGVVFITVSMDLPFAQKRWCTEAGVDDIKLLSDHKENSFGEKYGVLIKDLRLLARTVFVIDKEGKVAYVQYVKELGTEPDYDDVLAAVEKLK